MPFETATGAPRRIAVIGAGISGMGAADMLSADHHVTLFEAERRLGGHARTVMAGPGRETAVDTGFIVFNYSNYPHLAALFDGLGVEVEESSMSFGTSIGGGRLEYALHSIDALFAQRRNAFDPRFLRMVRDIFHFNKHALRLADDPNMTVGQLLETLGTGPWFRDYYLTPFTGAIWSTPTTRMLDFPAQAMMRFMANHALTSASGQHQWYSVTGGSDRYVQRLGARMAMNGVDVRLNAPTRGVRRTAMGVEVRAERGEWETFDEVVFATHSDDTLSMLSDPTPDEAAVLGAIRYQPNDVVLHSDTGMMPKRRKVWASWVYTEAKAKDCETIDLTYWMNSLQPWLTGQEFFVTLNATRPIREDLIWDTTVMRHPVYDLAALAAQKRVPEINGGNAAWFCGAWVKNGFHEDGLSSAVDVVEALRDAQVAALAAQ